jgi:hypothetical protein
LTAAQRNLAVDTQAGLQQIQQFAQPLPCGSRSSHAAGVVGIKPDDTCPIIWLATLYPKKGSPNALWVMMPAEK